MEAVQLMISMPHGKTTLLSAARTESVASVKRRALRSGMPRLALWRGEGDCYMRTNTKLMQDRAAVADYEQGGGCVQAHLMMRQRGGCFMISFAILCVLALAAAATPFTCGTSLVIFPFLLPILFILPWFCL